MGTLKELKEGQGLILHAIFNPAPLHKVMERKGFDNKVEQIDAEPLQVARCTIVSLQGLKIVLNLSMK